MKTGVLPALLGATVVLSSAGWLEAVAVCTSDGCGACTPPAGFSISTLIDAADLPDTGQAVTAFVDPGDGSSRRFVASQEGMIWVWDGATGSILPTPFLDLTAKVIFPGPSGESGLLNMAVAPDYAASGDVYVFFTGNAPAAPGSDGNIVIQRYTRSVGDPNVADPAADNILVISHANGNHNGGSLVFGADGMLYVSTGDGGGSCDSTGPNGQNIGSISGKILRLDVQNLDPSATAPECGLFQNYEVPSGNPFQGATSGCGEIWSYGLRNPYRMTMDRQTGDFFLGDVGQSTWEEINFLRGDAPPPLNFGWKCREGCQSLTCAATNCPAGMASGESTCLYGFDVDPSPGTVTYWDPIACHENTPWQSIMGGYMYRGQRVPVIAGRYLYSDYFCGQVWGIASTFDRTDPAAATTSCLEDTGSGITGFGEDHLGELYIVRGGNARIDCVHAGSGCFWAGFRGLFEDDFESNGFTHWSGAVGN
jgi:hypothetical protein